MSPHLHPSFRDKWDPYRHREYIGHLLDKEHFNAIIDCDENGKLLHSVDCLGAGNLDAPDQIPFGSTQLIRTIAGFDREEYNRRGRDVLDVSEKDMEIANAELADMIKKILAETDK